MLKAMAERNTAAVDTVNSADVMSTSVSRAVASISNSVSLDTNIPSVADRYFTPYYYVPKKQMIRGEQREKTADLDSEQQQDSALEEIASLQHSKPLPVDTNVPSFKKAKLELAESVEQGVDAPGSIGIVRQLEKEDAGGNPVMGDERQYYVTGEETLVLVHSNKLCLLSLSPHHPIVRDSSKVVKVDFSVFGVDRLSNKVSGKGKRGAQVMGSKATLCTLHTEGGRTYHITCGARGKLLQVNEQLVSDPDLCRTGCGGEGWLGVVLPKLQEYDQMITALTPADEYQLTLNNKFRAPNRQSTLFT